MYDPRKEPFWDDIRWDRGREGGKGGVNQVERLKVILKNMGMFGIKWEI